MRDKVLATAIGVSGVVLLAIVLFLTSFAVGLGLEFARKVFGP